MSYDAIGRLIWATLPDGSSTTYVYDDNGNIEAIGTVASGADTDGDGIPDYYEIRYTGQTTGLNAFADLESDGQNNFTEFAFGRAPLTSDASPLTVVGLTSLPGNGNYLTLTYLRPRGATLLINYIPQVSQDLVIWSSLPADVEETLVVPQPDGLEQVTVRALASTTTQTRLFLRIRFQKR